MRKVRVLQIKVGPHWMDPIVLFLKEDALPPENGGKRSKNIIEFKVGCRPSKWGVRGQGCENARIFELG